jgi:integrase
MRSAPLRNIVRRDIHGENGEVVSWEVLDLSGRPIPACSLFIANLDGYKFATRKRYVEAVCRFVDYLYESGVLGGFGDDDVLPSRRRVNTAIDWYLPILLHGSAEAVKLLRTTNGNDRANGNEWLLQAVLSLRIRPCKRKSLDNVTPALNRFLRLSEALAQEAHEMANQHGVTLPVEYSPLINVVDGFSKLSSFERAAARSSSLLGSVIRMHGEIRRPSGIRHQANKQQADRLARDFPVSYMDALLDAATSWRDRALWLLLLASGIRRSEALNLQWTDVDYDGRRVYVLDPEGRRYGRFMTAAEKRRFKGRTVSWTYLWEPWRTRFFDALAEYRKREWRLPTDGNNYVFQKLKEEGGKTGVPLLAASDTALAEPFNKAVAKAEIPSPGIENDQWTPHSLRHAYGVYMLNYIPIAPGVCGFHETDVQCLMGHDSITSTRKYARRKEDVLRARLEYADQVALGLVPEISALQLDAERIMLPSLLAARVPLIVDAKKIAHD